MDHVEDSCDEQPRHPQIIVSGGQMFKNNRSSLGEAMNGGRTLKVVHLASLIAVTILIMATLPAKASPAAASSLTFNLSGDSQVTGATPGKNYENASYLQV